MFDSTFLEISVLQLNHCEKITAWKKSKEQEMHFPQLGPFICLSLPCVYFSASSKFGNHSGSAYMQNCSTEYLHQASSILQQACDDGTQGLQGLLYATEVRPQTSPTQVFPDT